MTGGDTRVKRGTARSRALRLAGTGLYEDYRKIEMLVGAFLDAETRAEVNRLCALAHQPAAIAQVPSGASYVPST